MSDNTGIEWTDATWNPVTGCTKVSAGCDHCYAETIAHRFAGTKAYPDGFAVTLRPERLDQPLRWRHPRRIFVNSMADLFHDSVPDEYIAQVWQVMASAPQHTFQILTKRHARMRAWVRRCAVSPGGWITHDGTDPAGAYEGTGQIVGYPERPDRGPVTGRRGGQPRYKPAPVAYGWPLPNVWLGVSVENQQWADIRIPALLDTPAAVRFLSCEPLLGPVNLIGQGGNLRGAGVYALPDPPDYDGGEPICQDHGVERCSQGCTFIDWVIVGGESGPGARPMHPGWARSLRDQCAAAGVPFLFKQWGEWAPGSAPPGVRGADAVVAQNDGEWLTPPHRLWDEKPHTDTENRRGWAFVHRAGKKAAGRELDGRTWDEYPDSQPHADVASNEAVTA